MSRIKNYTRAYDDGVGSFDPSAFIIEDAEVPHDVCGLCAHYLHGKLENNCRGWSILRSVGPLQPACQKFTTQTINTMEEHLTKKETPATKVCPKCGRELPAEDFGKHARAKDSQQPVREGNPGPRSGDGAAPPWLRCKMHQDHRTMNKIDQIKAEIERLIEINKTKNGFPAGTICAARIEAYEVLLERINSLPDETSEDLEEAVQRYYSDNFDYITSDQPTLSILTNIARHFADWQREQMMKEAKEGYVSAVITHTDSEEEHYAVTYPIGERRCSVSDNVKIILVKED